MNTRIVRTAALVVAVLGLHAAPASAQFAKPEDAIKYRQSTMFLMSNHAGRLAGVVRGQRPFDAASVQADAALIETLSKLPFDAYVAGTDKGAPTRVKPEIWSNPDGFRNRAAEMQKAATALATAARGGSLEQLRPAFGELGRACKACHDDFRRD